MTTKILLTMPQPGETISEGVVVRWIAQAGDSLKEGDMVVELETEKALFEYESPYEGTLVEIIATEGMTVAVGNPIAVFEVDDEKASQYFMLGLGSQNELAPEEAPQDKLQKQQETPAEKRKTKKVYKDRPLSPYIRKKIKEHNLSQDEVASIEGSGREGRLTKNDLLTYLKNKTQDLPSHEATQVKQDESLEDIMAGELVSCSPVRLRIAKHMKESVDTIPHAHTSVTVDMTDILAFRAQNKELFLKKEGIKLGLAPLLLPAIQKAIQKVPETNARFEEDKKSIRYFKKINLGVAVGTPKGLFIPVIHHLEGKSFLAVCHDMDSLIERAQSGRLTVHDLTGMTFTFNNFGYFGTEMGMQIILPPQTATLGMGALVQRPWVVGDEICVRTVSEFTLSFDHRVIDGMEAGVFLSTLKEELESFDSDQFSF